MYDSAAGKLLVEEANKDGDRNKTIFHSNNIRSIKDRGIEYDMGSQIFASSTEIYDQIRQKKDLHKSLQQIFSNLS